MIERYACHGVYSLPILRLIEVANDVIVNEDCSYTGCRDYNSKS